MPPERLGTRLYATRGPAEATLHRVTDIEVRCGAHMARRIVSVEVVFERVPDPCAEAPETAPTLSVDRPPAHRSLAAPRRVQRAPARATSRPSSTDESVAPTAVSVRPVPVPPMGLFPPRDHPPAARSLLTESTSTPLGHRGSTG